MKKYLVTLLFALIASFSFVQAQEGHRFYCEIKGFEKGLKPCKKVVFDFGNITSYDFWNCKSSRLKFVDENGKVLKFKSLVEAANFLVERGWTFDKAYSAAYKPKKSITHWVFYKDTYNDEEVKDGLVTSKQYKRMKKADKRAAKEAQKAEKKTAK